MVREPVGELELRAPIVQLSEALVTLGYTATGGRPPEGDRGAERSGDQGAAHVVLHAAGSDRQER
jgi:hypothetical protein